jgi:hypothetical protein
MALDLDHRVLCFDGEVWSDKVDFSLVDELRANGIFVVRSIGGDAYTAMKIANSLRDRHSAVVVYDYCFSACASFFLVASDEAFVAKDTLVAWHDVSWPLCPSLGGAKDGGPQRLAKVACDDTPLKYREGKIAADKAIDEFYAARVVDPLLFEDPPESYEIRKKLRSMFEGTGRYPDVIWTWNPRYYASALKTKITYEAYPSSQDEVDALVSKFGFRIRVLYDP